MTLVEKNLKKRPDEYTELIKTLQKGDLNTFYIPKYLII